MPVEILSVPDAAVGLISFAASILVAYGIGHLDSFVCRGPVVKGLYIYPIKSAKGMKVSSACITPRGFKHDRQYMVVSSDGVFVTQRKYAKMALIVPIVLEKEGVMVVSAPGMPELRIPLGPPANPVTREVRVWSSICRADVIPEAGKWISQFLGVEDLELVRMCDDFVRETDPDFAPEGQTAFNDGFPFLLTSEASLDELNHKLDEAITMERFRPNIVVGNVGPFAEDSWKRIEILPHDGLEGMVLDVVKPCSRCPIPNIDPRTAVSNPATTIALKSFRTGEALGFANPKWKSSVFFGQNVDHRGQSGVTLAVGTSLRVYK